MPTKLSLGVRTVRAEREMIADVDPRVERLARIGDTDPSYKMLIHHVENRTDIKYVEENSEMRQIGLASKELAIFTCKNGFKLVVRNGVELYIPAMARKEILAELHSTHLATAGMKQQATNTIFWPMISKDLESVYKTKAKSKSNVNSKRVEVRPSTMEIADPGERICTNFSDFRRISLCIIKNIYYGMLAVYGTKEKTSESAIRCIRTWMHRYGLTVKVSSDQEPSYSARFQEWLNSCSIHHCVSSAYNAQNNGAAEKGVQQIKSLLTKLGKKSKIEEDELEEIVFRINSHVQPGEGSALDRFFIRSIRTYVPELIMKQIDHQALIQARKDRQIKLSQKLGRRSTDEIRIGDKVLLQHHQTLCWTIKGQVK